MPNNFFQFKQFKVEQGKSAMKVCTDACIFGAWISKKVYELKLPVSNCLDIGTGTGLLSLMLAQQNRDIQFDAVEIERNAFEQAKENFLKSPWNSCLNAIHTDIKNYDSSLSYDFIISNPPFFQNDLLPVNENKKIAKHVQELSLETLVIIITELIATKGYFAIMLSYNTAIYFEKLVEQSGLFIIEKLFVRQTPLHNFFRTILFCGTQQQLLVQHELIIKNIEGEYTNDFKELLKDYYLDL